MLNAEANTRRGLISKIHIAKKQMALDDDSYQAILQRAAGKTSCKDMKTQQLETVVKEFQRLGWKKPPVKRAGTRTMADSLTARKVRAMWLSLYHLGAVRDPSEAALASFAQRTARVSALQWMTPAKADKIIKAMRGWLEREGVVHPVAADVIDLQRTRAGAVSKASQEPDDYNGMAAKIALIRCQLKKLDWKEADMLKAVNDRGLGFHQSVNLIRAEDYDAVVEFLGKEVRSVI